jgi:hypothetical protein
MYNIYTQGVNMRLWKDIKGYEGLYQISNFGEIKSLKRKVNFRNFKRTINEKILKPYKDSNNYLKINLSKNKKSKMFLVHRLVAKAFINNVNNKNQVNHKDNNHSNNNVNNLEWVNQSENIQHAYDNGFMCSYEVFQYDKKGNFIKKYKNAYDAYEKTGIAISSIRYAILGFKKTKNNILNFKHAGGYIWKRQQGGLEN